MLENRKYQPIPDKNYKITPLDLPSGVDPEDLLKHVIPTVVDYTTLIIPPKLSGDDRQPVGAGVLVDCCGLRGILTAHHVVKRMKTGLSYLSIRLGQIQRIPIDVSQWEVDGRCEAVVIGKMKKDER